MKLENYFKALETTPVELRKAVKDYYDELDKAFEETQVDAIIRVLGTSEARVKDMREHLQALLEKHDNLETGLVYAIESYLEW